MPVRCDILLTEIGSLGPKPNNKDKAMKEKNKRVDSWGHPALTESKVVRIAESMIPQRLRPYYIGVGDGPLRQELSEPFSEWNTDIILYFRYPVISTAVDGVRYAHSDLEHMAEELESLAFDESSLNDEEYAEYDEGCEGLEVVQIRDEKPLTGWHKEAV